MLVCRRQTLLPNRPRKTETSIKTGKGVKRVLAAPANRACVPLARAKMRDNFANKPLNLL